MTYSPSEGRFIDAEQAVATPAFSSEPRACRLNRWDESGESIEVAKRVLEKGVLAPAIEPCCR
ncbi:hypothetical protein LZC95_13820 [Pendulispora brunnea]|uniref:Uncharacterized protein n=1 Tax=Pendulispora brunnea TaxID=2905690 RepID=A0ABZ2KTK1_9BACT